MNNITLNAVIKQIKAMACVKYKIGVFDRSKKIMINSHDLEDDKVINLVPWLKFKNFEGNDIYITQADDIDRALLLVDDLTRAQIEAMRLRGVAPACVVETSPNNYQAWVSLGQTPMPKQERKVAARLLADQFEGDKASADPNHYGRLAGFTNRKKIHLTSSGYPFVMCREADGRDAERSQPLREWARARCQAPSDESASKSVTAKRPPLRPRNDPAAAFSSYFKQWAQHVKAYGKKMDFSRGDFAVVSRMLKEGFDKEQIRLALMQYSPDIQTRKENHIEDYIIRTILAAEKYIL
jgi:hypothetical protein